MSWTIVRKFDRPAATERGLIRKINRRLPECEKLRKARPYAEALRILRSRLNRNNR